MAWECCKCGAKVSSIYIECTKCGSDKVKLDRWQRLNQPETIPPPTNQSKENLEQDQSDTNVFPPKTQKAKMQPKVSGNPYTVDYGHMGFIVFRSMVSTALIAICRRGYRQHIRLYIGNIISEGLFVKLAYNNISDDYFQFDLADTL